VILLLGRLLYARGYNEKINILLQSKKNKTSMYFK